MPLLEMREATAWRNNMAIVNFSWVDSIWVVDVAFFKSSWGALPSC
jgi:hypothetical protein